MSALAPLEELLARCDREPIHIPGAVQPHGAVIAVDAAKWRVTHLSANLGTFLNAEAARALGYPLADMLGEDVTSLLRHEIQTRRGGAGNAGYDAGLAGGRVRLLPFVGAPGSVCIDVLREPPSDAAEPALIEAQRVVQSLRLSRTSAGLCRIAVNDIRRITGYDRVMVYRFDEDGSGDVIAENHSGEVTGFLGLKYPASDIPQQARRLYMLQRIRIIPDVNAVPVELLAVPGSRPNDIDLSTSWVRAVSPIHLQYLRHMGVAATAVVSLIVGGRLWGMLVCHHNTPRYVNADQRALLELVGQVMSVMLGSLAESEVSASRIQRQAALGRIASAAAMHDVGIVDAFAASASDLVNLLPAHGAVVLIGDRKIAIGHTPEPEAFQTILTSLAAAGADDLIASAELRDLVADKAAPLDGFAGALLLPLQSCGNGSIIWFRRELNLTVNWAGNPNKIAPDPETGRLEPRLSFASWREEVHGRSAPWTEADMSAARELRRIVDEALVRRSESELLIRLRDNDPLTGLLNRRALEEHLLEIRPSSEGTPATLIVLNIDRFRKVNQLIDNRGGDALLVQIAHRLQVILEPGETAARLGPDEFGIVSTNALADVLARRVSGVFSPPFEIAKQLLHIHASVGVADNRAAGGDISGLLRAAEAAMRQSKMAGGNRVSFFAEAAGEGASRDLLIEQSLDTALRSERGQFRLAFQPIVDVLTGGLRSWEILLRWHHPTLGPIPPSVFIPIAESSGLIAAVGDLVLEESARHLLEIPPNGEAAGPDPYLSVNASPLQLTRVGFAEEIATLLHTRGIYPSRLCIEVTEGVFANQEAVATIAAIRALGVLVAVDDFGIGYSSLSTLQRMPADVVKLDRSFLPEEDAPLSNDRSFLSAVVTLAHTAGLKVVVEGVETQWQLNAVVLAGADAIQGYFLGRPMTGEDAAALACQHPHERSWHSKLEIARRFAAGTCL